MKRNFLALLLFGCAFAISCGEDEAAASGPVYVDGVITVTPETKYQEMVGFGGALTWYSDRVIANSKREEIYQLMFEDLGMDILRLKNWYYPLDYPANKSPQTMLTQGDKTMFDANNTFYAKAKEYNPNVKVLLCSWGPPPTLKSNDHLREGTLKKDADGYMYDEFATYWSDILDHIGFTPDYISIQNEPGYTNTGWTTCAWSPTETAALAGYSEAFDAVYEKIKNRTNLPVMIGPESENVPSFLGGFAAAMKDKPHCPIYAYHPYNFNESTAITQTASLLDDIQANYGNKPNFMTEYSSMSWFKTARFIHYNLQSANTSAYLYWDMVWGDPGTKDKAMIYVDNSSYTVTPFYYVMKHYAKFIDAGYRRVEATAASPAHEVTAYMNPEENQLTLVMINSGTKAYKYDINPQNKTVNAIKAYQTVEGSYFKDLGVLNVSEPVIIPAQSITTIVVNL